MVNTRMSEQDACKHFLKVYASKNAGRICILFQFGERAVVDLMWWLLEDNDKQV